MSEASPAGPPPSSLVARLQGGQAEAWESFVRLYGPLIYSWCRTRWGLPPQEAAKVLQDVVARVVQSIGGYRGDNFVSWLWAVTRSRAANHWKERPDRAAGGSDAQRRLAEVADRRGPEVAALPGEPAGSTPLPGVLRRAVERVRARSAETSWQAFWQVTAEGRRPADVAADLGLSLNAVYIASSRVLSRLRNELDVKGPEE
jgi:RNA polymerase sigma-70 factor (ECF subfamily)